MNKEQLMNALGDAHDEFVRLAYDGIARVKDEAKKDALYKSMGIAFAEFEKMWHGFNAAIKEEVIPLTKEEFLELIEVPSTLENYIHEIDEDCWGALSEAENTYAALTELLNSSVLGISRTGNSYGYGAMVQVEFSTNYGSLIYMFLPKRIVKV